MENKNITEAVTAFVAKNQEAFDAHAKAHLPRLIEMNGNTTLKFEFAKKYVKVWCWRYDRKDSIHAFIDIATGDVLMPAGLNKPAKHSRGNIFAEDGGASAFTEGGYIRYLK